MTYRPIPSRPRYWAGSDGSIWSHCRDVPFKRKNSVLPNGRAYICFPGPQLAQVSRLVLEAFRGPCPPGMECCHNNGNCLDNRIANLRWDTRASNLLDCIAHGSNRGKEGEGNHKAKLTAVAVGVVMRLHRQGLSTAAIARRVGVKKNAVWNITTGRTWSHVTGLVKVNPRKSS